MKHSPVAFLIRFFGNLLVPTVSLTACVSTNAAVLNPTAKYAETCPDAVMLYTSPDRVPSPYREVALLNSTGNTAFTSEKGMYNSQRQKAAHLGANGIVLNDIQEPGAGAKIIGSLLGTGTERKGRALAIYVPEDSMRTIQICQGGAATAAARQPVAPTTYGTAAPAPAPSRAPASATADPVQQPSVTAPSPVATRLADDIPAGTQYIADTKTRTYYSVSCPAAFKIPETQRLYYRSEAALASTGYSRNEQC
jgi:hypothetical protein